MKKTRRFVWYIKKNAYLCRNKYKKINKVQKYGSN